MRTLIRSLPALAALALAACASFAPAPKAAPDGVRAIATPTPGGRTVEGGFVDGFAYSEKPGDVMLGRVVVTDGVARITGDIDPRRGSIWGGIGLTTSMAPGNRTVDISSSRALVVGLSANGVNTLRVRLVGNNTVTRDAGCYPVVQVRVTPEMRDYTLPITSFAPDSYCSANSPRGPATASALVAVEVADPSVTPGHKRQVDFSIGTMRVTP